MFVNNKRGGLEILYILLMIVLFTIPMSSLYKYHNNIVNISNQSKKINNSWQEINNISSNIAKHIENGTYSDFNSYNDYSIQVEKLTSNVIEGNYIDDVLQPKEIKKDFTNSYIINCNEKFELEKDLNFNYFIISDSNEGINVSYSNDFNNIEYSLANIDKHYYYGIEEKNSDNKTLYFKQNSTSTQDKIFYYRYRNNAKNYNFYIAKITKNEEIFYNIYIEDKFSIKEIYSYKK